MNFFSGGAATLPAFSAASFFSAYASLTALLTLIQQFYHQFVPEPVRCYISKKLEQWFTKSKSSTSSFTLVIEQYEDNDYDFYNQVFEACEAYLASKLKSCSYRLKASRPSTKGPVSYKLAQGEKYSEYFEEVQLHWRFVCSNSEADSVTAENSSTASRNKYFELSFNPDQKDKVFESYLPSILEFYDRVTERKKELKLYSHEGGTSNSWRSVKFEHPFTFDSLALDLNFKRTVIDDLDRFVKRKEFYKKIGRAWKRGYLLYGPPGTGKSSLVAAMANHLKFDIYDLQLSVVRNDSMLRRLLLSTTNKSILVIEDIDCSLGLSKRHCSGEGMNNETGYGNGNGDDADKDPKISLSGLLNFIDGLWSSCGDERIIIFTTNYKDKLDPALLRPGRMDMHIHMSYLTMSGFRVLASNYLNISGEHHLFGEIEELLQATNVTPAQVAEELIRSDDPDIALSKLVEMLKGNNEEPKQRVQTRKNSKSRNGEDEIIGRAELSKFVSNDVSDGVSDDFSSGSSTE